MLHFLPYTYEVPAAPVFVAIVVRVVRDVESNGGRPLVVPARLL